jgi:CDGSH-type Zn-finger protein
LFPVERNVEETRTDGGGQEVEVTITPYRDGPYLVRGPFALRDVDGEPIPVNRRTIALCRCGKSRTRPYCDGTHKLIDFRAPGVLETWPPEAVEASR